MVGEQIECEDRTSKAFIHLPELHHCRRSLGGILGDGLRSTAQGAHQASVPETQHRVGPVIGSAFGHGPSSSFRPNITFVA